MFVRVVVAIGVAIVLGILDVAWDQLRFWYDWKKGTCIFGLIYILGLAVLGVVAAVLWPHTVVDTTAGTGSQVATGAVRALALSAVGRVALGGGSEWAQRMHSLLTLFRGWLYSAADREATRTVTIKLYGLTPQELLPVAERLHAEADATGSGSSQDETSVFLSNLVGLAVRIAELRAVINGQPLPPPAALTHRVIPVPALAAAPDSVAQATVPYVRALILQTKLTRAEVGI